LSVRRDDSEANREMNRRPRLRIYTAIPCVYGGLS
jgi:hypothetical protein